MTLREKWTHLKKESSDTARLIVCIGKGKSRVTIAREPAITNGLLQLRPVNAALHVFNSLAVFPLHPLASKPVFNRNCGFHRLLLSTSDSAYSETVSPVPGVLSDIYIFAFPINAGITLMPFSIVYSTNENITFLIFRVHAYKLIFFKIVEHIVNFLSTSYLLFLL